MATRNNKHWMMFSFKIGQLVKNRHISNVGRITCISVHNPKCSANLWPLSYMYTVQWTSGYTGKYYAHDLQFVRYTSLIPATYSYSFLIMLLKTNQLPALKL